MIMEKPQMRKWLLGLVAVLILLGGGFGIYWFASADSRACEKFRKAVDLKITRAIGVEDKGFHDIGVDFWFDAGYVEVDGTTYDRPAGCEAATGTRFGNDPTPSDA